MNLEVEYRADNFTSKIFSARATVEQNVRTNLTFINEKLHNMCIDVDGSAG